VTEGVKRTISAEGGKKRGKKAPQFILYKAGGPEHWERTKREHQAKKGGGYSRRA